MFFGHIYLYISIYHICIWICFNSPMIYVVVVLVVDRVYEFMYQFITPRILWRRLLLIWACFLMNKVCLSIHPRVHLSVYHPSTRTICASSHLPFYPSVHLSSCVHLSIYHHLWINHHVSMCSTIAPLVSTYWAMKMWSIPLHHCSCCFLRRSSAYAIYLSMQLWLRSSRPLSSLKSGDPLLPWKLTCPLKINGCKMYSLLK